MALIADEPTEIIGHESAIESYLLNCLIEECSEVIKAATKVKRFGWDNHHPDKVNVTNAEKLGSELNDLVASMQMLRDNLNLTRRHYLDADPRAVSDHKMKIYQFLTDLGLV